MRTDYENELEFEWEQGQGGSSESLLGEQPLARRPITIPPIVICGGPPNQRLTGFEFKRATPTARIAVMIHCVACLIVGRERTAAPVRNICLEGHTDNRGPASLNNTLGLQRAREVQKRLVRAIELLRPGLTGRITFSPSSAGMGSPIASNATPAGRARNRRVEVFLRK